MAQIVAAEADRLARARTVHHQHGNAALDEVGDAAHVLRLFRHVEAVEEHHARLAGAVAVLRVDEIARQTAVDERHFDDFDRHVRQTDVTLETLDAAAIDRETALVLGRAEPFAEEVVVGRT